MNNPLDAYAMKARLVPAVIAGAPAFAFAAIFVSWGSLGFTHLIADTALTVLFAAFADVARRRGKAIEPKLIERMGGLPSTTMLRIATRPTTRTPRPAATHSSRPSSASRRPQPRKKPSIRTRPTATTPAARRGCARTAATRRSLTSCSTRTLATDSAATYSV